MALGRLFKFEGFFSEVFVTLTSGAFMTAVALALGAGPVALALLAALPFFAQVGQLAAPALERRLGSRRRFVVPAAMASRLLWLIPAALLLVGAKGTGAVAVATVAVFAVALLGMIAQNGWMAWMADLVPEDKRASLFGGRSWAAALGMLVAAPAASLLLDFLEGGGAEPVGLVGLSVVAAACGAIGAAGLGRLPDAAPGRQSKGETLRLLRRMVQRKEMRLIFGLFGLWNFAIGLSAPFWTLYMLGHLGMGFVPIVIHTCLTLLVRLACTDLWAKVIERVGSRRVLIVCGFAVATNPLFWFFAGPDTWWPLWVEAIFSGISWTGFNQAAFLQPISVLTPSERSRGLAIFHVVTGAPLFLASILGGALLSALGQSPMAFLIIFGLSALLRVVTSALALRLTEPGVGVRGFFVQFVGAGLLRRPAAGALHGGVAAKKEG